MTHVNTTIVHNVYIDRTVIVNRNITRISYNGGTRGLQTQATARELAVARQEHLPRTKAQGQHVRIASQDRRLLATVNHNRPPVLAVRQPLTTKNRPVGLPAVHPVAPVVEPTYRTPPIRPVPAIHTPVGRPKAVVPRETTHDKKDEHRSVHRF